MMKQFITNLLHQANIAVAGDQPWDIAVHDDRFYRAVGTHGSLGLGEAYMNGWWDVSQLDQFFHRVLAAKLDTKVQLNWPVLAAVITGRLFNLQRQAKAFEIGQRHYDIGNDLYQRMLDERLTYTCGYWKDAQTLDQAQEAKLDLVCKKIGVQPGQRVLDIGGGWGSFAKFAAERYGAHVVAITVSQAQVDLGQKLCAGLPVELRLQDYRDVHDSFDHIVSLGMFEHVGVKNYHSYMKVVQRCLKANGLFLLHTIGSNVSGMSTDPWIAKYIFPNSMIPSLKQIATATEGRLVMEDWHNFSADYDATLLAWFHNFDTHWSEIKQHYSERFYRMWKYYLLSCAGAFRARNLQLWQIVFSKAGIVGGYHSIR
ncbi:MAG: cyclopropane fatty acyl phospholipid synthase [Candidatus Kerfeldbacteria bacterium]|nr:cyclopropane fatty acyl phospholipid synthase [Candidatus Kerfeldbacteria bacterium]